MAATRPKRDELYEEAAATCGTALDRVARAYEPDPDKRRDLLQEIHVALWRSLENFEGRCSLKTWVYRIAHNTATSVVILLYLEGMEAASIGEITGISPGNVATKIHRIKNLLSRKFHRGERHAK